MPAIPQSELPKYNCISLLCSKVEEPEMLLNYISLIRHCIPKGGK